jgi:hopanoid-associated phosphorylase
MQGEAAIFSAWDFASLGIKILCSGPGPHRAAEAARQLCAVGVGGLVSFGLAGGCAPDLAPGALLFAREVVDRRTQALWPCQTAPGFLETWRKAGVSSCRLAGSDTPLIHSAEKQEIWRTLGASAVDMESHAVAAVAAVAGVPFLALRIVADPAHRVLPNAALAGLTQRGETQILPVLSALLRRPRELPALIALAQDHAQAHRRMKDGARMLLEWHKTYTLRGS